ncbi:GNAT family N-acetyltransferase [Rhizobium sp. 007]|uniref:GNAT family N-acetyltransferase n=1 Tax=Rhizobium sp. 007 TaxID=2785056 RepID=UPI00188F599F|nr:GNAT family N-acetyltransferase [Rhizobium sp. 007]QPB21568.1 GNAT family N-acetyltransferase [Rhizobium sp. 007]
MCPYKIRRLDRNDASSFREIRLEALANHPEAFGASWVEEQSQSGAQFADRLENGLVIGGLFDDGMLAGTIGVSKSKGIKTQHIGSIWGMYVRQTARGTGLSRLLLSAAIDEVGTILRSLRLSVVSSNVPAIRLYKSVGFEEWAVEIEALKVGETYYDEILMRLELGPR